MYKHQQTLSCRVMAYNKSQTEKTEVTETLHSLRDTYGDNWLRSGASERLQDLLGIQETKEETNTDILIQKMMDREQRERVDDSKEDNNLPITESVKSVSQRSSDEIPDAIDNADDRTDLVDLWNGIESLKKEVKIISKSLA